MRGKKMLINKRIVKEYAMECAQERHHTFTRVSKEFLVYIEAKLKTDIRDYIRNLPSKGKTIR